MRIYRTGANKPKVHESFGTDLSTKRGFRFENIAPAAHDCALDLCLENVKDGNKGAFDWTITLDEDEVKELILLLFSHPHKLEGILGQEGVAETVLAGIGWQHNSHLDNSSSQ